MIFNFQGLEVYSTCGKKYIEMNKIIKQHTEYLIQLGVEKIKKFGFVNITKENITTDEVYSYYFVIILNELLGTNPKVDEAINQLLDSMKSK